METLSRSDVVRSWPFPRAFKAGEGTLYTRFCSYVHRRQDHQCWNWTGATRGNMNYGLLMEWRDNKRVARIAHRLAWEFCFGPIPKGMLVRHMCHNPACCNPSHLLLGSHKDNFQDKINAKREKDSVMLKGENNRNAKLTASQVAKIKSSHDKTIYQLADEYGVSKSLISAIRNGKVWQHLETSNGHSS